MHTLTYVYSCTPRYVHTHTPDTHTHSCDSAITPLFEEQNWAQEIASDQNLVAAEWCFPWRGLRFLFLSSQPPFCYLHQRAAPENWKMHFLWRPSLKHRIVNLFIVSLQSAWWIRKEVYPNWLRFVRRSNEEKEADKELYQASADENTDWANWQAHFFSSRMFFFILYMTWENKMMTVQLMRRLQGIFI